MNTQETDRILHAYRRRKGTETRYAPWRIDFALMHFERTWLAASMLQRSGWIPGEASRCLEIGYGTMGWLPELLRWGVPSSNICGMELDKTRAAVAQRIFAGANLQVGDASQLPWGDEAFDLVVLSTVFSSVLDDQMRKDIAAEVARVLRVDGRLLWYDIRLNNPRNPDIRKVGRKELWSLFPGFSGTIKTVTLAPPILRLTGEHFPPIAMMLSMVAVLRTHLIAVLKKERSEF